MVAVMIDTEGCTGYYGSKLIKLSNEDLRRAQTSRKLGLLDPHLIEAYV